MPSLHHESRIAQILEEHPKAKRGGFQRWARDFYEEHWPRPSECGGCDETPCCCEVYWLEERTGWAEVFRFRPDAWEIREGEHGLDIVCWEVHVSGNPEEKMARYIEAFWMLDDLGPYYLRLIHIDAFGREAELDLCAEWYRRLRAEGTNG